MGIDLADAATGWVWEKLRAGRFKDKGKGLRPWCARVIRHCYLDLLRKRQRSTPTKASDEMAQLQVRHYSARQRESRRNAERLPANPVDRAAALFVASHDEFPPCDRAVLRRWSALGGVIIGCIPAAPLRLQMRFIQRTRREHT
jgi:hypothetical protein